MSKSGKNKILLENLLVLALLVAGLEIVLRIYFPVATYHMDVHSGLASIAGWGPTLRKGSNEFLCDNPHPQSPGARKVRVLTLGDSLLDCNESGTQPFEITIPAILQKSLGDAWDVYNLSAGGWGTDQEYLAYHALEGKYKPDWVILFFTPANDLYNNSSAKAAFEDRLKPVFTLKNGALELSPMPSASAADNSIFRQMLLGTEIGKRIYLAAHEHGLIDADTSGASGMTAVGSELETETYSHMAPSFKPLLPRYKESWEVTRQLLIKFNREVKKNGSRFAMVYVPTGIRNLCEPLSEYPANCIGYGAQEEIPVTCNGESMTIAPYYQYELLKGLGAEEGFPILQSFTQFRPYADRHTQLARDCIHFNKPKGAEFVVGPVEEFLKKNEGPVQ